MYLESKKANTFIVAQVVIVTALNSSYTIVCFSLFRKVVFPHILHPSLVHQCDRHIKGFNQ